MKAGVGVVSLALEARDAREAQALAVGQGYAVLGVQGGGGLKLPSRRAVFPLLLFTQELLALLRSGISLVEALETLAEKEAKAETRAALGRLLAALYEGKPFSAALALDAQTFPDLYVASVRASERTGDLPEALSRFVAYQTQLDLVRKKVVSAAIYPVIILIVAALVVLFLLAYVVPRFSAVYEDMGDRIPFASRVLLQWGKLVEAHGVMLGIGFIVGVVALGMWLMRPATRTLLVGWLRRFPSLGERLRVYQLIRFYRTLGMLLSGGIPILQAMGMVSGLLDPQLRARMAGAQGMIREGKPISQAMEGHGLTTPVALRLLRVGERTGQMGEMMERIAVFHEDEVARWIDVTVKALGPALMAVIGVVIGGVVVLMYLPIFELAGSLQ
ncbi:MAG: type II secretion system F family protein [Burkholderiales bacterium]|nr:type II secretion system F family protein [Burkholderiales bacterium]